MGTVPQEAPDMASEYINKLKQQIPVEKATALYNEGLYRANRIG